MNQLTVQIQDLQDKVKSLNDSRISMILRRQAALGYPTFPVIFHISYKTAEEYNATRKITCQSLSRDCQPDLLVRLQLHLQHRHRRTQQIPRQVQHLHDVEVHAVEHWETSCTTLKIQKTNMRTLNKALGIQSHDLPGWLENFTQKSCGRRSFSIKGDTRKHFS